MVIFSYTGSPQVKISQKVLGGDTFLTHTVDCLNTCCCCCCDHLHAIIEHVKDDIPHRQKALAKFELIGLHVRHDGHVY